MDNFGLLIEHKKYDEYAVSILTGKSGDLIVIDFYGPDDFGAWWTDEKHLKDDTYGYSVRGTLESILIELKDEI